MPSRISVELSPSSATNSMTSLASPSSMTTPLPAKRAITLTPISTSPSTGTATMDDATMGHPATSPSSSSPSASFSSSSVSSSPSSSIISLPRSALPLTASQDKGKGKGKSSARAVNADTFDFHTIDSSMWAATCWANHNAVDACITQSSDMLVPMNNNSTISMGQQQQQQQLYGVHSQEPQLHPYPQGQGQGVAISPFSTSKLSSQLQQQQQEHHQASIEHDANLLDTKAKGKGKGKAPADLLESHSNGKGKGRILVGEYSDMDHDFDHSARPITLASQGRYTTHMGSREVSHGKSKAQAGSVASGSPTRSDLYTHSNARSSNSSSLTSLSSVEEEEDEDNPSATPKTEPSLSSASKARPVAVSGTTGKGKASYPISTFNTGSESGPSSHPRAALSYAQVSCSNGVGCSSGGSSGSGSGSGSGSNSKPSLYRAATGPATLQRPFLASASSSSAVPTVPNYRAPAVSKEQEANEAQDFSQYSYDALPDDFDFGDLPFYDTDPRTGTIYGDPHAITRPYLVPSAYFDLYRFTHDEADPKRTNVFNKYGTLLYYHPGRHIGQEQDSLRSQAYNQPVWTMAGRTSTWGTLTATDMVSKRQIKVVMENNKKKAGGETNEPLARFVFRWKEDDFVVEYRKQKDQYRITCSQMCGGESKWKPPQPKPTQTMFHGMGMDTPGNVHIPLAVGTPSPFDPNRYLQLISEYRLQSGPVLKRGDFELYNPDTFPAEFRTFLMLVSVVILDIMRPVDDKLFFKEFPEAIHLKSKVVGTGGLKSVVGGGTGPVLNGRPAQMALVGHLGGTTMTATGSVSSVDVSETTRKSQVSNHSSASMKAAAVSVVDVGPTSVPAMTRYATFKSENAVASPHPPAMMARSKTEMVTPTTTKKSRWRGIFGKK
ncbi:hypothetical protein EDD11_009361 [Mortierella claussenii]|nr:hypothetical protein EDD11_009361 [Mortierella claussenii]